MKSLRTYRSPSILLAHWDKQVTDEEHRRGEYKPNSRSRLMRRFCNELRAVITPFRDTPEELRSDPLDRNTAGITVPASPGAEGPPTEATAASLALYFEEVATAEDEHKGEVCEAMARLRLAEAHRWQRIRWAEKKHLDRCAGRVRCATCLGLLPAAGHMASQRVRGDDECPTCGGDRHRGRFF